jgi:hypothetical protein
MRDRPGLKWLLFSGLLFAIALCCGGCTLNKQFVDAMDTAWQEIGPEYTTYVNADINLDKDQKRNRIRTAQMLTEVIAVAKDKEGL